MMFSSPPTERTADPAGVHGGGATNRARARRSIFSMAVRGSSSVRTIASGSLWAANRPRAWVRSDSRSGTSPPARATTTATPISPMTGSVRGATATWATAGWSARTSSTSRGKTLYPPRTYISLDRPEIAGLHGAVGGEGGHRGLRVAVVAGHDRRRPQADLARLPRREPTIG